MAPFEIKKEISVKSSATQKILLSLLLIIATAALYAPVHRHEFVNYDDQLYVTDNTDIQSGVNWQTVKWAFTSTYRAANWHPLTWLSHALDCQLFLLDSGAHHDVNLALHACNALLLFWVLLEATGFPGRSWMIAALFAVHPINVESVAWIAERKNLLSMLFFLLALGAYRWYARQPAMGRYALVAFLYALGLMAKPQIITFPFVLLLWDYWPLRRMFASDQQLYPGTTPVADVVPPQKLSRLILEKLPLFALSAASGVITFKSQHTAGAMVWYPYSVRLENAIVAYLGYLGKALWPSRLAVLYPHPATFLPAWQVYASLLVLVLLTAVVAERRRPRYLAVGWFWFLGTLVPMVGLVQVGNQAMADRYAYLPFVGLFLMICWGVADWATRRRVSGPWLAGPSIALLLVLATVTHRQIGYWRDSVTLWSHAVQATRNNWVAEDNLGGLAMEQGRREEAVQHYLRAMAIDPDDFTSNLNIGAYEQQKGNLTVALEHYQKVVRLPQTPPRLRRMAFSNMGYVYLHLGDETRAQQCFAAAGNLLSK